MTTDHLAIPDELDQTLGKLGKSAMEDKDDDIDTAISGLETHRAHLIHGASVLVQKTDDHIDELMDEREERQEQRARIRGRVSSWSRRSPEPEAESMAEVPVTPPAPAPLFDQDRDESMAEVPVTPPTPVPTPAPTPAPAEEPHDRTRELPANNTNTQNTPQERMHIRIIRRIRNNPRKSVLAALAAAFVFVVVIVFTSHYYDDVLSWADGDAGWGDNGFVQFLFIFVPPALAAYWVWIFFPRSDDDTVDETTIETE